MEPRFIAWITAGLLAVATLIQLMRARQHQLTALLNSYVQSQLEWSRKRAKATRLAQKMARVKGDEEAAQISLHTTPQHQQHTLSQEKVA